MFSFSSTKVLSPRTTGGSTDSSQLVRVRYLSRLQAQGRKAGSMYQVGMINAVVPQQHTETYTTQPSLPTHPSWLYSAWRSGEAAPQRLPPRLSSSSSGSSPTTGGGPPSNPLYCSSSRRSAVSCRVGEQVDG